MMLHTIISGQKIVIALFFGLIAISCRVDSGSATKEQRVNGAYLFYIKMKEFGNSESEASNLLALGLLSCSSRQ